MNAGRGEKSLKQFAFLLAAQWLRDGVQAVFLLLLARHSLETYGNIMLAMSLGQILLFCSEFGINQHFMLLLASRSSAPSAVFRQITLLKGALFAAGSLVMTGFCLWQGYPPELMALVLIIGLSFGLDALVNSYYVVCQSLGRQDVEGRLRGMAALLGYGGGILAIFSGAGPLATALFKPLESLTALAGAFKMLCRSWRTSAQPLWGAVWSTWKGTLPFTLMALSAILYNKLNIFFLQRFGGAQAVAQYSATWQIVDGISVLASGLLLGKVLFPMFAKLWLNDQTAFVRKARAYAAQLSALALPVMFVLALGSEVIIGLLYGTQYGEAARVQPLLCLCVFFAFVHNLAYYLLLSMGRQMLVLWFFLAGLIVNAALCLTLMPSAPLDGAVWAIVSTKGFVALLTVGACQRSLGLLTVKAAAPLLLSAAGAAALTWAGRQAGFALAGELLALALLLFHLWQSHRTRTAAKEAPC
ncbi:MAG TPA: oligosaccharide flippase family protein [Humidesulfovibrio sp.]|uniref:oligosaccharide flippase family protein n=1 Tax=Humidesulfovibrio sp. TaxID=2910988 RepID=UPI002BA8E167|nr:oligosaccharide flippase family protein [Humidesulfovibrio sp.]HWR04150.1 oligosaccharide flippase family protein [Humidesulfovibrio sp.]